MPLRGSIHVDLSGVWVLRSPRVSATRVNHVSIRAVDMDESVRFYEDVFGMERVATPIFAEPVACLQLGAQQLHLFEVGNAVPRSHHVPIDVDDFPAADRQ